MRKILLSILGALLVIIAILFMVNGMAIGSLQVLGFQGLSEKNQELTNQISTANEKKEQYTQELDKIEQNTKSLAAAKKEYLDLVTISSTSDIQKALQTKTYTIEYLWSRVGNYATREGITVKMEVAASSLGGSEYKNLNFTANGNYLAITNFIYDIENDTDLDFTIDNFDMKKDTASFVVKDIKILPEATTAQTTTSSQSSTTTNQTTAASDSTNTTDNTTKQ